MRRNSFHKILAFFGLTLLTLSMVGCSKDKQAQSTENKPIPDVETFPIANSILTRCRFAIPAPRYTLNSRIAPNVIQCDEGVPKRVEVLSANPLPNGLELDPEQLALVGTPKERVQNATYVVYLENEAGYVKIQLSITVQ